MQNEKFELYLFQKEFADKLIRRVSQVKSVIGCSPGGTGKTKTFIHIAQRACATGHTTIIITDRKKVFNQVSEEAKGILINDKVRYVPIGAGRLYVGMVKCMNSAKRSQIINDINKLEKPALIILDECHFSTANSLLEKITNKLLIGFTATPHIRWAKHLPLIYKDCIITHPIDWFISNDYLCSYRHIARSVDLSGLVKRAGEFTEESQNKLYGARKLYKGLEEDLKKFPFKKCMIFCASILNAEETYEDLLSHGFKCSIGHSKRKDEALQLAQFTELNETNILVSVGAYSTGFDYPPVDMIVLYRATTSLPLYLQMIFRGNRKKPGMFFTVLDYGENGLPERHKPYWYNHDWQTLWRVDDKKKKIKDGVPLIKICGECESMIPSNARICPYCNYQLPPTEHELAEGKLIDLTASYNVMKQRKVSTLTPIELASFARMTNKKKYAERVCRWHEKRGEAYLEIYAKQMNYKDKWIDYQRQQLESETIIDFYDIVIK